MRTYVAYVPVLHEGYRRFFEKYEGPKNLFLFGPEIIIEFPWLSKEIRALDPSLIKKAIEALGIFEHVEILDSSAAKKLNESNTELILPDEDISRELAKKYFPQSKTIFDSVFLRWDKHNSIKEKPIVPDENISHNEFDRKVLAQTQKIAEKSSDIWRHIGSAVVKNGEIVLSAYNKHVPSSHSPYVSGDPRNNFHRGDHIEISTAMHSEAAIIAEAARTGFALEGLDMYVTVFPCPPCAKLIAFSGIKKLYCTGGYAVLDGEEVLKSSGVKIIYVE